MDEQIRQMKQYLRPRIFPREITLLLAAALSISIIILFIFVEIVHYLETGSLSDRWIVFFFWLFCLLVSFLGGIIRNMQFEDQLRIWEQTGDIYDILADFESAKPMYGGRIMMGTKYAFGKNCGAAIAYANIERIYESVRYVNVFFRDQRHMQVKMINEKMHNLCYLKMFRKKTEELAIVQTILEHNPTIKVGFR